MKYTYYGDKPPLQVIVLMQTGRMRVNRSAKIDRQSVEVYFLNFGYDFVLDREGTPERRRGPST